MKFSVKKRHIKLGMRGSCTRCPVALALVEALEKGGFVSDLVDVMEGTITIGSLRYSPPRKVTQFIIDFDDRKPVRPLNFLLPIKFLEKA